MGNTFSHPTCNHCGTPRQLQATGRPGKYCSTKCRQAAHRQRHTPSLPQDTEQFDQALRIQLNQITDKAREILLALEDPCAQPDEPLEQMVRLQVLAEHLTPNMVARTKQRGTSWERIGNLLGMNKDTARKKWSLPARRSLPPQRPVLAPPRPPSSGALAPADPDSTGDGADRRSHTAPPPAGPPARPLLASQDLATVLSSLQRASKLSLRSLAGRTGMSPSYLSRIMSGERFPAWEKVEDLARACGADPEVLRRVYEASNARRDGPRPVSLAAALRYLHMRAGSPTAWAIAVTSGGELDQDLITDLLAGTTTGQWPDVQRLVQLLDGEPAYFLPLWEAETPVTPAPEPNTAPQPPAVRAPAETPPPSARLEELLTAFRGAFGPPRPHHPPLLRRCLAAPIRGATHWDGR
ncbi:helix-turn-helix domain-containing protein [Streptomyces sp. NPDC059010]|uniref:helix-turn-helix domain-containing protein n=1 Tax=Streptomyces sp. NPDC059010 TaxID=3346695 RepID=UPI0036A4D9BC